jgi:iron complex outermembrane recepter protein
MSGHLMRALCGGVSLVVMAAALPAVAQDAAPAVKTGTTAQIEEITVTARRHEEDVQKVPIAISAVSGASIDQHGIQNGQDLSRLVPALSTNQTSRDEEGYAIRGLSNSGATFEGLENNVAPYFSQVPYPTDDGGGPGRYFDLANVQVLKGPQGTLFGRNSTGGAVLFEPNRPSGDYDGYASVQYGNDNDQVYEGMLNIPILPDELMLRVAGKREERDGFTTNIINGQKLDNRDYWSGRVGLEWRPNEVFDNYMVFDSYYSDTSGSSEEFLAGNPGFVLQRLGANQQPTAGACFIGVTLGGPVGPPFGLGGPVPGCSFPGSVVVYPNPDLQNAVALQQALGPRQIASDINSIDKSWSWGFTDIATTNITPDVTLKNIFGYREFKQLLRLDEDGSNLPILDQLTPGGWTENLAQYTDEVNFHVKTLNDKLDVTAGNFFLFSHPAGTQNEVTEQLGLPPAGEVQPIAAIGSFVNQDIRANETSEALYGEAVYDMSGISDMLKDLKFTVGYRYTWDHRSLNEAAPRTGNPSSPPCAVGTAPLCQFDVNADFQAPSWNIGFDYQLDPNTLLYVTARRGYRSGGLNTTVATVDQTLFKPEIVKDWEIGFKNDWKVAGLKGRTDIALYHDDIQDAQVNQTFVAPNGDFIALINNSATATVNGVEVDTTVIPLPDVQVTGAWAYTKGEYNNFTALQAGGAGSALQLGGSQPFPFVPLNRFSLDVRYFLPVPESWGDVSVSGTEYYSTHTLLAVQPDPTSLQAAYHQLDLHLDWNQVAGKPVDLSLFATNVYNSLYRIGGFPIYNTIGYSSGIYNEPQMFGLKLKYRWGAGAQ